MTTTQPKTKTAIWIPGWYELDQPLTLGSTGRLWFYQQPPNDLPEVESYDFVFFNQLSAAANCQVRNAHIDSIEHSVIGPLKHINTNGLDYIFEPVEGEPITVNAEENPGQVLGDPVEFTDWSVVVTLSDVSEPIADST